MPQRQRNGLGPNTKAILILCLLHLCLVFLVQILFQIDIFLFFTSFILRAPKESGSENRNEQANATLKAFGVCLLFNGHKNKWDPIG